MAVLSVRLWPDPVLTTKAKPVDVIDDELRKFMEDMALTMYKADGVGLAAPQVGVSKRVIVIDVPGDEQEAGSV